MALQYLFDPNKQFQSLGGVNEVGGFLRVFLNGTDDRATTYKNFDGTLNEADIVLDSYGRAVVIVDDTKTYRIEVYNRLGGLMWTVSNYKARGGSGGGSGTPVSVEGTVGEIDVDENTEGGVKHYVVSLAATIKNAIATLTMAVNGVANALNGKKDKQQPYSFSGNTTKTVKRFSQNENGDVSMEFQDIDFPEQAPNVNITSPNNTIEIQSSTEGGVKTFEIDVKGSNLEYYRSFTHDIIPVSNTGSGSFSLKDYIRKSDGTLDISQKFSAGNYLVVGEFNAIPTEVKNLDVTLGIYTHQGFQQVMVDCSKPIVPNQSQENVGTHFTIASFIKIPSGYEVIPDFRIQYQSNESTTINVECWDFSVIKLDGILSGQGGGGTEYTEGEGIKIENDKISVDYGSGLEVDPQTNKLKVKIGNGIEYIDVATTMTDILSIIDNGKLPVMRVIAGQGYDYYYPSWVGSGLTFVHIGRSGVVVKMWDNQVSGWTDVAGYDTALSSTSSNAVQNKAVDIEFGKVGGSIAPRYDSTQTYSVGDYVMYNRRLYVCNTAINTAEEWDNTKWTQTDVADIIGDVETLLAAL